MSLCPREDDGKKDSLESAAILLEEMNRKEENNFDKNECDWSGGKVLRGKRLSHEGISVSLHHVSPCVFY